MTNFFNLLITEYREELIATSLVLMVIAGWLYLMKRDFDRGRF